jgi:MFS family permease
VIYSIHINYFLPFHSEEYDHLILARETIKQEKIKAGSNWEIGFSVFLAVMNSVLLNNLHEFLVFVPLLFGLIISLSSFLLGRYLFRSTLAGLFFGLFSLMTPSSPEIMGLWFSTPNAMALALTPLLLFLFLKGTRDKKTAFLFIILFAFTTIVHPAFTLLLIPALALYLLINPRLFKKNQFKIALALIALLFLFPFFSSRIGLEEISLSHATLSSISKNITKVLVWESITQYNPQFKLIDFLGLYSLILAGFGIGLILCLRLLIEAKRRKGKISVMEEDFTVSRHQIIIPILILILGFLYIHFNLRQYTFIAPYERMYLALMFFLLLSAASGLFISWRIITNRTSRQNSKFISVAFVAVVLFFILFLPFSKQTELYRNIETDGMHSLEWIKNFTPKNSSFIALPKNSLVIRALTERKIFASPPTRAGIPDDYRMEKFFIQNCKQKTETIHKTQAEFIFSEKELSCNSFNKVYDKKQYKIYKVLDS